MTYKDIKNTLETYNKKLNEAFMIYGDHEPTNKKWVLFLNAKNKRDAAFAALFDFCMVYKNRSTSENKMLENGCDEAISHYDAVVENGGVPSEKEEFDYVYGSVLKNALQLKGKDFTRLIKYGDKKRLKHLSNDMVKRRKREEKDIKDLLNRMVYTYNKYVSDKSEREAFCFHVGTSKEQISAYRDLITKEEVMYMILSLAIHDAIDSKDNNFNLNKTLVESLYENFEIQNEAKVRFFDEDAYVLSRNGFLPYESTFEMVYDLSNESKKKLVKSINKKIKER